MSLQINKIISSVIQIGTMLGLMCLTLMNMEIRWCEADMVLAYAVPVLGAVGLACLWMNKVLWEWTRIDYTVGIWMAYWLLRVWIGGEYPCATTVLQMCWMCLLYVVLRIIFVGCSYTLLYIGVGIILLFGAIESGWGFCQMIYGTSLHSTFLITGNFLNPGPYSAYPMMGAIAGISLHNLNFNPNTNFFQPSSGQVNADLKRYFGIVIEVLTLICLMVLPATWSRAAWLGVGVIALWLYRQRYWKWRWYVWTVLIVLAIVVFFVKQGSAEGRLIIWAAALASWWENPIWGVGYGGFNHACAEGIAALYHHDPMMFPSFQSAGVTEYSYNALLQILVEQGIVGAVLCVGMIILALKRMHQVCPPLMYCILSLLVFSCFSYPFEMLPYRIILVMSLAITASNQASGAEKRCRIWPPMLLGCIAIAISIPLLKETKERKSIYEDSRLMVGTHDAYFLKDLWPLIPQNLDNPRVLFEMAKMLQEKGRWRDSNALLRKGTKVSADPMFYVLQGNNYQQEGFDDLAEEAYLKAFSIMPNRHYPLYQLMLLYDKTQQDEKAIEMAKRIINMKPKVKSPATDEMQQKAKEYLNRI